MKAFAPICCGLDSGRDVAQLTSPYGSIGVTDNETEWPAAQGARHKEAQSKNRSQGSKGKEGQSEKEIEANGVRRSHTIGQRERRFMP